MRFRNILVAYNGSESARAALSYAAALAAEGEAHVTALLAHSTLEDYVSQSRWIPQQTRDIISRANTETADSIGAIFDRQRKQFDLGDRLVFQKSGGRVDAVLAQSARGYDLLIVGNTQGEHVDEHVALHPDKIALQSGKPVVVVPESYQQIATSNRVVVAWDGRRAVARALSDAIPMFDGGGHVTLLTIGSAPLPRPIDEITVHLQRHGVAVDHVHRSEPRDVAGTILEHCYKTQPGMLVMGAYEHSKFRVDLLGGITSIVLNRCPVPVLMSH